MSRQLPDDVAEAVRAARLDRGLTQRDLAEQVGVSQVGISRYELGLRVPSRPVAKLLVAALNLDAYTASKLHILAQPSPQAVA